MGLCVHHSLHPNYVYGGCRTSYIIVDSTMKRNILFSIVIQLILLCSCSENVNHVIDEVSLNGQIVKVDSTNKYIWPKFLFRDILYAWRINYYGGKLTNNEWQKSDSLLVSGHGHNEFEHIVLSQDNDGTLFVLNCPMMGDKLISLTKIPHADSIAAIKEQSKWKKYDLGQLPPFWNSGRNFVVLSDSSILVAGTLVNEINHIFSTIDFKNQRAVPLDYWPDDGLKCDSISKYQLYATQCVLLGNGKGKFLYKNDWGRVAFIFTIDGQKVNILSSLYSHTFTKAPPTEQLACCVNSNSIFMLLRDSNSKGVKLDKYNEKKPFIFGNTIEIYDWDGVKQQVIHLDKYGQDIMISEDSNTLYLFPGYSDDTPEPIIYSYNLNNL